MAEKRDYYEVLGVSKTATDAEIKKAFRQQAKKYHPDIHPGDKECEEKFKEAQEAYAVLSDPDKRRQYDQLISQAWIWGIFLVTFSEISSEVEEAVAEEMVLHRVQMSVSV